ncbi:TIM44-like domain-containing protein [candidate division WOR-3 bacterium]|nr:TIM44-like domain-containing protein [candidate division WOR-3 bacterium]
MKKKFIVLLFLAVLLLAPLGVLTARAGGGESYGGGGGGGGGGGSFGGGGSGGDGGGELILCLIWLIIKYPCIGIPLTVFLIIMAIVAKVKGSGAITDRNLKRAQKAVKSRNVDKNLNSLIAKDPNFSLESMKTRVATAFLAIQKAWSNQDLKKVTAFMSDGVYERFSLQIDMQKAEGWRNIMENVIVQNIELVSALTDRNFDTLHFSVKAKAKDYKVNIATGRTIPGSMINDSFTEIWTFLRKADVKTLGKKGAFEGNCPNCAAPLEITDAGTCKACNAFVRSPSYDWILSEITQVEEWEPRSSESSVYIKNELSDKDPHFSTQFIEDRASVIFYRYQSALFTGNAVHLKKVAFPQEYGKLEAQIARNKNGDTAPYYRFPAVGKSETLWVQAGDEMDKIHVLIKWSGSAAERSISTGKTHDTGPRSIRMTVFTLIRKSGVLSPSDSFASSHCPNCGAPEVRDSRDVCPYCGTVLNDGSRSWVLGDMQDYSHWIRENRQKWTEESQKSVLSQSNNPYSVVEALAAMMFADGNVDETEKKTLSKFALKYNISGSSLDDIVKRASSGQWTWSIPEDKEQKSQFLHALIDMALSDGRVSSSEWKILKKVAYNSSIDDVMLKKIVIERQKALIQFGKNYFKKTDKNIDPPPPENWE